MQVGRMQFLVAMTLAGAVAFPAVAGATFAGRNGPIAYRQTDPGADGSTLVRARPDGSAVRILSGDPGLFSDWRADGRRIAYDVFDADGNEQIATASRRGGDVRLITSGPGIHEVPSWAPGGHRIVYDYSPDADPNTPGFETRLWVMRADGSGAHPLAMRSPGFDVEPRWSPDGRRIAFNRIRPADGGMAIFVVSVRGGRVRRLTPYDGSEHPTWSPDGRWILFDVPPDGSIEAVRPSGRGRRTILPARRRFGAHKPQVSPNGRRLLFMCENQGTLKKAPSDYDEDICVAHRDGSHVVDVTRTPRMMENWPAWSPAPR